MQRRHFIADLFLFVLWCVFAAAWIRTYHLTTPKDVQDSIFFIGAVVCLYALTITYWIRHNLALAKRKERRQTSRDVKVIPFDAKLLIQADLLKEQEIRVTVVNGVKTYQAVKEKDDGSEVSSRNGKERRTGTGTSRHFSGPF